MGHLSGFKYAEIVHRLKVLGFQFDRTAKGSHEIWVNPTTFRWTTVQKHSGDMPEGTMRAILRQSGIPV